MHIEDSTLEEFEVMELLAMKAERKLAEVNLKLAKANQRLAEANQKNQALILQTITAVRLMKESNLSDELICYCFQIDSATLKEWLEGNTSSFE